MTERIGIGLVGAGGIARARHVPGFRALPGVEIVGVVNRTPDSTARAAAELAIARTWAGWEALVADPEVDAVVVATWPYLHAPIAIAALRAGKHVLVEGRMAMDATEARAMLAAAEAQPDRVAMVVPAPFGFADATIRRLLAGGVIGGLRTVRVSWSGGIAPTGRDQWRRERRHSGNNVMTLGILYESVARWLGQATEVSASLRTFAPTQEGPDGTAITADIPDVAAVIAGFPGGIVATFGIAGYGRPDPVNGATLVGTAGALRVDLAGSRLELAAGGAAFEEVPIPDEERWAWRVEAEFVGAIRRTEPVRLTDFATGVHYMAFTDAVHEAARTGCRVAL
ncbi:MAG TPA: Gfo/Idh/MocA family oxidoreductase [Candidatus Nanopelagicales bacterium]|nr:Gfo/Idh/MocA family oxidoreductase [Candidatus Nanopelagicales bacterium]